MKNPTRLGIIVVLLLALLSACGSKQATPVSVALTPDMANVYVTQSVQFTATVLDSTNGAVTWSLSGAGCNGASCGTISDTGLYTAPASVPDPAAVTVKATSVADTSKSASATVTILAASNVWTWVGGVNTLYQTGTYGTRGVPSPSNIPGARMWSTSWTDAAGDFWLFGGGDYPGYLNDLWKYDPASREWTWVSGDMLENQAGVYGTKGIPAPLNVPGGRYTAVSWVDAGGNFWLFGGEGMDATGNFGELNDLWKFDPVTIEWTWVSGSNVAFQPGNYGIKGAASPTNVPGARWLASSWTDSKGGFWLFGGSGYDSLGYGAAALNDLWFFDPTTCQWTWISGSNTGDQLGAYGTKGIPSVLNVPGAGPGAMSWIDSQDKLWLFGGWRWGADFAGNLDRINDLWKFDPATLEWTWVSGSSTVGQGGVYGTKGTADPANVPGGRDCAGRAVDAQGRFWLFGGTGYYATGEGGFLNDLWSFDPATLQWTWIAGGDMGDQEGVYGTKGVPDSENLPGGRCPAGFWMDRQGTFWLFGGSAINGAGQWGFLNDFWKYNR